MEDICNFSRQISFVVSRKKVSSTRDLESRHVWDCWLARLEVLYNRARVSQMRRRRSDPEWVDKLRHAHSVKVRSKTSTACGRGATNFHIHILVSSFDWPVFCVMRWSAA